MKDFGFFGIGVKGMPCYGVIPCHDVTPPVMVLAHVMMLPHVMALTAAVTAFLEHNY